MRNEDKRVGSQWDREAQRKKGKTFFLYSTYTPAAQEQNQKEEKVIDSFNLLLGRRHYRHRPNGLMLDVLRDFSGPAARGESLVLGSHSISFFSPYTLGSHRGGFFFTTHRRQVVPLFSVHSIDHQCV